MKQHLIALDLDGTLLTDDKKITEKTALAIQKAKDAGHIVMIATGRPYRATALYYKQLGLTTPVVNFNGAFVHHPLDQSWNPIHEPLSLSTVKDVIESMKEFPYNNLVAEVKDKVYVHFHDELVLNNFKMGKPTVTTGEIQEYLKEDPTSLLIQADESNVETIQTHLQNVHAEVVGNRIWNAPWGYVIEIFRNGLSKAAGLAHVANWLDLPKDRIIAFGDENNDLEMIDYAGTGIAMSNGIAELQAIADDITTFSNNEDGIADMLNKRLQLE